MEHILCNLAGSKPKRVAENGKTFWVGNAVALRSRVLPGSQGPLFYKANDNLAAVPAWNNVRICVDHPRDAQGREISINDAKDWPVVGEVRRVTGNDAGDVRFQIWVDEERGFASDRDLKANRRQTWFDRYLRGDPVECSTGLFTDNAPAPPNSNHMGAPFTHFATNHRPDHFAILPDQRGACSVADGCGLNVNEGTKDKSTTNLHKGGSNMERSAIVQWLVANCECWKNKQALLDNEEAFSADDLNNLKVNAEKLTKLTANAAKPTVNETCPDCGKEMVDGKCACGAMKANAATANNGSLQRVLDGAGAAPTKKLTDNEWLAAAPPGIQSAVRNAMAAEQGMREGLVKRLIVNVANADRKRELAAKYLKYSVEDLQDMVSVLPVDNAQQHSQTTSGVALFHGAAGYGSVPTDNGEAEYIVNGDPFGGINNEWQSKIVARRKELLRDKA